jgi:hypothetical protein
MALPVWMTVATPTANTTSQASAASLRESFAVNAARGRNAGGGWGLSIESQRSFGAAIVANSDDPSTWDATGVPVVTANSALAPNNANEATTVVLVAGLCGLVINSESNFPALSSYAASVWIMPLDGLAQIEILDLLGTVGTQTFNLTQGRWQRISRNIDLPPGLTTMVVGLTAAIGGERFLLWGGAIEQDNAVGSSDAPYPSSYLPVQGPAVIFRLGMVANVDPTVAVINGWYDLSLKYVPYYSSSEISASTAEIVLVAFGPAALDRIVYQPTTQQFAVWNANVQRAVSAPVSFQRDQVLTISARVTHEGIRLDVAGATVGDGTYLSGATPVSLGAPTEVSVLSRNSQCSDLRAIAFYQPGG